MGVGWAGVTPVGIRDSLCPPPSSLRALLAADSLSEHPIANHKTAGKNLSMSATF